MTATIERGSATEPVTPQPSAPARVKAPTPRKSHGFLGSANGKKVVMALTGAVMVSFLVLHMLGNLKIFFGKDSFNEYAHWLRTLLEPFVPYRTVLTILEIGLVLAVALHIWAAVSLTRQARRARPVRYAVKKAQAQGYTTHIMRYGGFTLALYVVWHLLDLTFGYVNPAGPNSTPADRMIQGFAPSHWWMTLIYAVAVVLVGLHLKHGVWSMFQTIGWATGGRRRVLRLSATALSVVLALGFLAPPLAITLGFKG